MITPLRNNIVFKPFMQAEKTTGGIIVPESFRKESDRGVIIKVGNGTSKRPMQFKEGQIAYRVHKWGIPIEENGELVYIMDDRAILSTE